MKTVLHVLLKTSPDEAARLRELQALFAQACNAISPLVQKTRVWNRVALHHMAYKLLRERFPRIGSQMACNAIYSVSRHSRLLFQGTGSPFHLSKLGDRPLPLIQFMPTAPVYFDRHTLSLKDGSVSMYTLDGRMRFQIGLDAQGERNFREKKLREIVLSRLPGGAFQLAFTFADEEPPEAAEPQGAPAPGDLPEYMMVEESHAIL